MGNTTEEFNKEFIKNRIDLFNSTVQSVYDFYDIEYDEEHSITVIETVEEIDDKFVITGEVEVLISYHRTIQDNGTILIEEEWDMENVTLELPKFVFTENSLAVLTVKIEEYIRKVNTTC